MARGAIRKLRDRENPFAASSSVGASVEVSQPDDETKVVKSGVVEAGKQIVKAGIVIIAGSAIITKLYLKFRP